MKRIALALLLLWPLADTPLPALAQSPTFSCEPEESTRNDTEI